MKHYAEQYGSVKETSGGIVDEMDRIWEERISVSGHLNNLDQVTARKSVPQGPTERVEGAAPGRALLRGGCCA